MKIPCQNCKTSGESLQLNDLQHESDEGFPKKKAPENAFPAFP
jgi:hypothetical protein